MQALIGEIVVGVGHIHECNLIYSDFFLKNILLNHDGHILMLGLGTCRRPGEPVLKIPQKCSPEELVTKSSCMSSDWWCLGLLAY